jgi:flagellar protein FlaJ
MKGIRLKKIYLLIVLSSVITGAVILINFLYLRTVTYLFSSINIIALFLFVLPVVMIKYMEHRKVQMIEEMFPIFLRDFVESIRGGMTVPYALKSVSKNDYRVLGPYIKKMAAQMDWGIPADKVFLKFSKESKSKLIGRIISSVVESHRFGGNLSDTFEALSNTSLEVDRLREERKLFLNSQMMTGYIVFFVFLVVIIGLERFLVPSLSQVSSAGMGMAIMGNPQEDLANEYKSIFRNLILIQGLFAGLTVGKMAEGSTISGVKHSMFMMFVGMLIFIVSSGIK